MNQDGLDPVSTNFIDTLFNHIPVLILRLTPEGLVLAANPEVARATGYEVKHLIGLNFWGLLFPGKLFQQVPKFLRTVRDGGIIRDRPMVMNTKSGKECVVSWSRFTSRMADGKVVEIVCTGVDLTQRLIDADRMELPEIKEKSVKNTSIGQPKPIEGEMVAPLAIIPPMMRYQSNAIGEVENYLAVVEQRSEALHLRLGKDFSDFQAGHHGVEGRALLLSAQLDMGSQRSAIGEVESTVKNVLTLCQRKSSSEKRKDS